MVLKVGEQFRGSIDWKIRMWKVSLILFFPAVETLVCQHKICCYYINPKSN